MDPRMEIQTQIQAKPNGLAVLNYSALHIFITNPFPTSAFELGGMGGMKLQSNY